MLRRLRLRLTLLCTVMTGIILAGVTASAYVIARDRQEQSGFSLFLSSVNAIVFHIGTQTVLDQSWMAQTENDNRLIVSIETNGVPLLYSGSWTPKTERGALIRSAREAMQAAGFSLDIPPSARGNTDYFFFSLKGEQGERYHAAAVRVPMPRRWVGLMVLGDLTELDGQIRSLAIIYTMLAVCGTALLALFSFWFTGRAIRPVEESHRRQTEFVAAASHELRTPLAVIRTSAAALPSASPQQSARFTQSIDRECRGMSRLVDDLLMLARADAGTWTIQRQPVDIETLLLTQSESFEGVAAEKGLSISVEFGGDEALPAVTGDEQRLGQVLSILLDNAISYTPSGGRIRLGASMVNDAVRLSVSDTGPGISGEASVHLFDRFYRADPSRSKKEHYGLGLSIAKEIAALHGGKISVHNNDGAPGCTFLVELPLGRPRAPRRGR